MFVENQLLLWRNIPLPSVGPKGKQSKKHVASSATAEHRLIFGEL
jgi:hypothetical protein